MSARKFTWYESMVVCLPITYLSQVFNWHLMRSRCALSCLTTHVQTSCFLVSKACYELVLTQSVHSDKGTCICALRGGAQRGGCNWGARGRNVIWIHAELCCVTLYCVALWYHCTVMYRFISLCIVPLVTSVITSKVWHWLCQVTLSSSIVPLRAVARQTVM